MKDRDIGVWLDERKALLVYQQSGTQKIKTITSGVEEFHPKGGSRSSTKWGPQEAISESNYLNRRRSQQKKYFQKIIKDLDNIERLYILGPADTRELFRKEFLSSSPTIPNRMRIEAADSMTENQLKARVREHFKG